MSQPPLQVADFTGAMQALLPTGDAWPREATTVMAQLAAGLAPQHQALYASAAEFLDVEGDPRTANLMLADWEAAFGLPDPCTPLNPTLTQRHNALLARITAEGGQSEAYYIAFAATLGYTITITTFTPFDFGESYFGDELGGPEWFFAWQANVPSAGTEVGCRLARLAPAQGVLWINYT